MIATESLSRIEKLRLIEQFWDELSHRPEGVESPAWHADALRETEMAVANGEAVFVDWNLAKERLRQGGAMDSHP
ncbi:MAG: acyl-protein synthetase [Hydrogenophilales bacterium CG_4_10_14_3_um_filter_63_21]|nr:MAG: acyl-protein synthetase [Hydrogenophilales bacterium CG_4_10_14_3_um_filter_63_21]